MRVLPEYARHTVCVCVCVHATRCAQLLYVCSGSQLLDVCSDAWREWIVSLLDRDREREGRGCEKKREGDCKRGEEGETRILECSTCYVTPTNVCAQLLHVCGDAWGKKKKSKQRNTFVWSDAW